MSVAIACIELELFLPYAASLKDKRQVLHRLKDRLKAKLPVLAAEIGFHEQWQRALIAVVLVGSERRVVEAQVNQVRDLCAEILAGELAGFRWEWR